MSLFLGVIFSGFVDARAASSRGATLDLAQVQWTRAVSAAQPAGFTVALVAGDAGDAVHSAEPGAFRHVYQASAAYRLRNGVVVEGGIYPSHIGLESFYSRDDWNQTRGLMAEASPYYQAGVKASYALDERWSARVDVLNGWQRIDGDFGSAIGTQLAYDGRAASASLNTYFGDRRFVDLVAFYKATPKLQLGATVDFGRQRTSWNGAGLFARTALGDRQAFAVRAERFHDPGRVVAQTSREATLTYELRPRRNLILRLETRVEHELAAVAGAVLTF